MLTNLRFILFSLLVVLCATNSEGQAFEWVKTVPDKLINVEPFPNNKFVQLSEVSTPPLSHTYNVLRIEDIQGNNFWRDTIHSGVKG